MIPSTHALTGAVIGKSINNPWIIILVSLVVHFILDSFRHGDYLHEKSTSKEIFKKVSLDLSIGFSIIMAYIYFSSLNATEIRNISIGVLASLFPDFLTFLYLRLNFQSLKKIFDFHSAIHHTPIFAREKKWDKKGLINDFILSIISIVILFFLN